MDAKHKLPVYLRLRPKSTNATSQFLEHIPGESRVVTDPPKDSRYKARETFSFSGIYGESALQQDVYKGLVFPLVENFLHGRDSLLFTMGASGSGKTHTMLGYKNTPGMIHFAFDTIFRSLKSRIAEFEDVEAVCDGVRPARTSAAMEAGLVVDWSKPSRAHTSNRLMLDQAVDVDSSYMYAVYFTMVEIYNDRVFDLFGGNGAGGSGGGAHRKALTLKTDGDTGRVTLGEARKLFVTDKDEAFRIVEHGLSTRAAHSTGANTASSRSHAFLIIEMKRIPADGSELVKSCTLTLVDLAGSERVKTAKTTGNRLVESGAINKSLMLLGQCLQMQRSKDGTKIDSSTFRNSKLTQLLLANAFNEKLGQKSAILVNIDPYGDFNAAAQILRYSALARDVAVPQTRVTSLSKVKQQVAETAPSHNETKPQKAPEVPDTPDDTPNTAAELEVANARIQELEYLLEAAEAEAADIEARVRAEMSDEMDRRLAEMRRSFRERMDEEWEQNQEVADRKIAILNGLSADPTDEIVRLRSDNEALRQENEHLASIVHHADFSPSRKKSRVA